MTSIGKALEAFFIEHEIKYTDFAKHYECTPSNVTQMLSDNYNPSAATLAKIVRICEELTIEPDAKRFIGVYFDLENGWTLDLEQLNTKSKTLAAKVIEVLVKQYNVDPDYLSIKED